MIDFGSLHEKGLSCQAGARTLRYCSANTIANRAVVEKDDLESLGFVLFDAYFGIQQSPLNQTPTEETKQQLCQDALNSKYGSFFQEYYSILASNKNHYEELKSLAERHMS